MGKHYRQITMDEREVIAKLHHEGKKSRPMSEEGRQAGGPGSRTRLFAPVCGPNLPLGGRLSLLPAGSLWSVPDKQLQLLHFDVEFGT